MSSVLILGMGYLGSPLAHRLVTQGYKVQGTYVKSKPLITHHNLQVDVFNITEPDALQNKQPWQIAKTWVCLLPPSCSSNYVQGLVEWIALAEQYQVEHIIYTSSISVFSDIEGVLDELSPTSPMSESAQKILAVEQAILNSHIPHKTILRLAGLFDKERHPVYRLAQRIAIDNGQQTVNMVHRDDAVAALMHAVATPGGSRLRHIVHPQHPTREMFYQKQAQLLNVQLPPFHLGTISGKIIQTRYDDFPIPVRGIGTGND